MNVLGFISGLESIADIANAAWYLAEGNYLDAAMSGLSAMYDVAGAYAAAKYTTTAGKIAGVAADAEKVASVAGQAGRHADDVAEQAKKITQSIIDEKSSKVLYRGEKSTVTPEEVFKNGFSPKGTHNDPLLHTKSNSTAGNFVSTSCDFEIAVEFAGKNGYVYIIKTNNYIDINSTYGNLAHYPEQKEFSIPNGIKPFEVVGAYNKEKGEVVGELIFNSNFLDK